MPGFYLYTSNRVEHLIPFLGDLISAPRASIFEPEIIVVQNKGMEQWLSLQLAEHLKILAFCQFPFTNTFFNQLFSRLIPEFSSLLPFDPELLFWKIYKLLPDLIDNDLYVTLRLYLNEKEPLRLFQLSRKIADIFDQYSMYRPEMITSWELDSDNNWQALLWRELISEYPSHRNHLKSMFLDRILHDKIDKTLIPNRVSFFGISSLPPFFTDLVGLLSQVTDVHYFLLNPCAEYWDDIVSEKELKAILKIKKRKSKHEIDSLSMHYETGNPLLASLGTYGRDFLSRLHELDCIENVLPVSVEPHNLLTLIQSDILKLSKSNNFKKLVKRNDLSIQVHSCHSVLREIEVLHDNLLNLFNTIPNLKPSEIIVMAPDIESYIPYIKTIFGSNQNSPLPYTLADQSIKNESAIAEGFLDILEVATSRFTSTSIINLLEIDWLRDRFKLSIDEVSLIKSWIRRVGIRWGLDGESKRKHSIPPIYENSWKSGLDQLLLGFALPVNGTTLFNDIAGSNLIEGSTSETLGKFLDFYTKISRLQDLTEHNYTLEQWSRVILKVLDDFFVNNAINQQEFTNISKRLESFSLVQKLIDFTQTIPFEVIKTFITDQLSETRVPHGFLNGSITFCSMLPMRGIPFRIVCLIGLNECVYPRKSNNVSWDLIAAFPKKGDRSLEIEDRYVFLETLLSSRDFFYISYIGQNIQKNINQHPSVCVEELLDYIDKNYNLDQTIDDNYLSNNKLQQSIRDNITFRHRLHGFNPEYFHPNSVLFSYSIENFIGAKRMLEPQKKPSQFISSQLSEPSEEFTKVTIDDLVHFFSNPSRYLLQKRLGIYFKAPDEELNSVEPFNLAGLEKYDSSNKLLKSIINQDYNKENLYKFYKALNCLPHGLIGQHSFDELLSEVTEFTKKIKNYIIKNKLIETNFEYQNSTFSLKGRLDSIWPDHALYFRNATAKSKDYISAWINHLCLNIYESSNYPKSSILITKDVIETFNPVSNATELIDDLLKIYYDGLRSPLPFFPQCSWEYSLLVVKDQKSPGEAFKKAYKSWHNNNKYSFDKESDDPYVKVCFSEKNPVDHFFESTALRIFNPLISNILPTSDKG